MSRALYCATLLSLLSGVRPCSAQDSSAPAASIETSTVQACMTDHQSARLLRVREDWLAARKAMQSCASEACPLAIRSDCTAWLEELSRTLPTLLLVIERDDDGEQPVELELDGQRLNLPARTTPLELLPGTHRLRLRLPAYAPVERVVVLEKGEKNRLLYVRFTRQAQASAAGRTPDRAPASVAPEGARAPTRPVPVASYAFAGVALAAFASSAALLLSALASRSDARDSCAPRCDQERRSSIETRLLLSDVTGGLGILAGGAALFTFVTRPLVYSESASSAALPGADAQLLWRF